MATASEMPINTSASALDMAEAMVGNCVNAELTVGTEKPAAFIDLTTEAPCFVAGTWGKTPRGLIPVSSLRSVDAVLGPRSRATARMLRSKLTRMRWVILMDRCAATKLQHCSSSLPEPALPQLLAKNSRQIVSGLASGEPVVGTGALSTKQAPTK